MPSWSSKDLPAQSPDDPSMWTVAIAAKVLEVDERDLRDLIRIAGIKPSGKMQVRAFKSQGRIPAVYEARQLMALNEILCDLREIGHGD